MEILAQSLYDNIKHLLHKNPEALWFFEYIKTHHNGTILVDRLSMISSFVMITPSLEIFCGGIFYRSLMEEAFDYIKNEVIPSVEDKMAFIYTLNEDWNQPLSTLLYPYINTEYGQYLTRRIHHLNQTKYNLFKSSRTSSNPDYQMIIDKDSDVYKIDILFENEKIGYCTNSGEALGIVDIDLYIDEKHRRKGLASQVSIMFIDYYYSIGKEVKWGCWTANQASCSMAKIIGFEIIKEIPAIFVPFEM